MFPLVERFFFLPWTYRLVHLRQLLWGFLTLSCRPGPVLPSPLELRPPSDKQIKRQTNVFIESIDKDAICALASKHNGGLPCDIRSQSNGSFNVCFIVDFSDGTTRLLRLPLEPAVRIKFRLSAGMDFKHGDEDSKKDWRRRVAQHLDKMGHSDVVDAWWTFQDNTH